MNVTKFWHSIPLHLLIFVYFSLPYTIYVSEMDLSFYFCQIYLGYNTFLYDKYMSGGPVSNNMMDAVIYLRENVTVSIIMPQTPSVESKE